MDRARAGELRRREIVGVDGDTVELSNLNRQVLYGGEEDVGAPKADSAGRLLRAYDSALEYVPVATRLQSAADVLAAVRRRRRAGRCSWT